MTNDDGVDAPGIAALAAAASAAGHEVVVAAPAEEASGMSAALTAVTAEGRILMKRRPLGYGVAASPAYIVMLSFLEVFGAPPELVLSGINRGANAGNAVLHSGTVGAALTAAAHGARAMAVSLDVIDWSPDPSRGGAAITVADDAALHWTTAADLAAGLLDDLAAMPAGTVLNLNVPDRAEPPELRQVTLATFGQAQMAIAESGEDFVRMSVRQTTRRLEPGTDLAVLAEGYATVTALTPPTEARGVVIPRQRAARS